MQKTKFTPAGAKRVRTHAATIPDALKAFDSLPDSANVRLPVVVGLTGCSSATVWRRAKAGLLPKPRKLGPQTTVWNVGELRQCLAKLVEQ